VRSPAFPLCSRSSLNRVLGSNGAKCGAPYFVPNPECNKIRSRVGERALGGDFITICSAFSQRSEEGQQGIASLESDDGFAGRGEFLQSLLFDGQVGLDIAVRGLNALVTQPQGNDCDVYS
jgi:hypothetical protein